MKIALCLSGDDFDCQAAVRKMAAAQLAFASQRQETFAINGGALACVTTAGSECGVPLLKKAANGNILMIAGLPIDLRDSIERRLEGIMNGDFRTAAESLSCLEGAFAAVFWDALHARLTVVTDPLGMQPLYIFHERGRLFMATELKAFSAGGAVRVQMDPVGWGAFFSLGFNIADRTQLAGVKRVPAATVMTYDPLKDSLDSQTYWQWPSGGQETQLKDVDTDQIVQILRQEVQCYASYCRSATVLLSGGFDSRLILALLHEANLASHALVLAHQDEKFGADGIYARKIARLLNQGDCDLIQPSRKFYNSDSYLRFLSLNELTVPSLNLFIAQVMKYLNPQMGGVWEGVAPGFVFSPPVPFPGGFAEYLRRRCQGRQSPQWRAVFDVFTRARAQAMYEEFSNFLQTQIARYPDDEFGVSHFQVDNQLSHRIGVPPFTVYANKVMPLTPGFSRRIWELTGNLSLAVRGNSRLYFHLLARHFPQTLKVPFCSGGVLLSHRRFTPGLWAWDSLAYLSRKYRTCVQPLGKFPKAGPLLRGRGLLPDPVYKPNELVTRVVAAINPSHPDLDGDAVCAIKKKLTSRDWDIQSRCISLFYWQVWHWVMENRLDTQTAALPSGSIGGG